ncbi:MAG: hypothetical protein K1X87_11430 [Dehalococcoidia bacterium]|nr:hypothetical protein [Dehalococcoidia bacterium]
MHGFEALEEFGERWKHAPDILEDPGSGRVLEAEDPQHPARLVVVRPRERADLVQLAVERRYRCRPQQFKPAPPRLDPVAHPRFAQLPGQRINPLLFASLDIFREALRDVGNGRPQRILIGPRRHSLTEAPRAPVQYLAESPPGGQQRLDAAVHL